MYQPTVIKDEEYKALKARYDEYHAQRKVVCGKSNCVTPEQAKLLPPSLTSEEISSLEVYEFVFDPPTKYFAYVHEEERTVTYTQTHTYKVPSHITTWTGEVLGRITECSHTYKDNFGGERINIRVTAINGKHYYGTYYTSAGDYCRLTICKADK